MKQFLFITLCTIILFSCKKEKLEGNYSILIGEWKEIFSTDHSTHGCKLKVFDTTNPPKITFKKNGKIFVKKNDEEEKFLIRLDEVEDPPTSKVYFSCPQTIDTMENYFFFSAEISQRFSTIKHKTSIYVNENKMAISSYSNEIFSSPPCENCGTYVKHIFEKVN